MKTVRRYLQFNKVFWIWSDDRVGDIYSSVAFDLNEIRVCFFVFSKMLSACTLVPTSLWCEDKWIWILCALPIHQLHQTTEKLKERKKNIHKVWYHITANLRQCAASSVEIKMRTWNSFGPCEIENWLRNSKYPKKDYSSGLISGWVYTKWFIYGKKTSVLLSLSQ